MTDERSQASRSDHAYFQALETAFIRLRGAPLLLSPADWQVAKEWRQAGIPIELAVRVMERIFERQGESDKRLGIRSLRYFRKAVQRSWRRIQELGDSAQSPEPHSIDVPARLEQLAAAVAGACGAGESGSEVAGPLLEAWGQAVVGVAEEVASLAGDAPSVEAELQRIDRALMARLRAALDARTLAALEESARQSLAEMSGRMGSEAQQQAVDLLVTRRLRQMSDLPVLSLFAPPRSVS